MKLYPFFFLLGMTSAGFSQITIDQSDMPVVGDNIPRKSDTMTVLQGPGGSGPNQTWNFTATSNYVISENTSVVSVASTPNGNQFGTSNMAMTTDNANYLYFKNSAQSFSTQGFSGDLLGTGVINAAFSPDLTLHQFPRTFGSSFSDTYGINVTVPGQAINPLISQIKFKRSSLVKDTTDAWGKITTPHGTYDVLRIHTTEIATDSIFAMPLFPPTWTLVSSSKDTTHNYSWVGKGGKLAIAEMSFDTLGMPKIFKWTELPGIGVGMEENALSYSVNPNPFADYLNVEGDKTSALVIMDAFGNVLQVPSTLNQGNRLFDTRSLPSGMYFLRYQSQEVGRNEKLIKR